MDLVKKSKAVLTLYQHQSGAFPACPTFPVYNYCWLRDGTFCAYALDLTGETLSSRRYYYWIKETLSCYLFKLDTLFKKLGSSQVDDNDFLHTRYTLDGKEGSEPWGNFQLDGYGTYLWGLAEHCQITGSEEILDESAGVVQKVICYLQTVWREACLDCWEENKGLHPSTLAAIYGGLKAIQNLRPGWVRNDVLKDIYDYVLNNFSNGYHFVKLKGTSLLDANLLMVGVPFKLVDLDNFLWQNTVNKIATELKPAGVYRYLGDSYYGGGEWILLTAWLGWAYALQGERTKAEEILAWVDEQADPYGQLPEQTGRNVQNLNYYQEWVNRWGEVAKPLLWSHAMYLILAHSLNKLG